MDAGKADAGPVDAGTPDAGPLTLLGRSGTSIVNAAGNPVRLDGVNLGGWLLWEAPVWGGGNYGENDLRSHLTPDILSQDQLDSFASRVHNEYIAEADIARIAALGFTAVRVPMNHTLLEEDSAPYVYKDGGWALLDQILGWCENYRVYAVLDLHAAPGGQSRYFFADPDRVRLWDLPDDQDRTVALWRAIAARYATRDIVAGYDLLNEPDPPSGAALVTMYSRIAAAIRGVDARHLLFVEGANYARDFSMFTSLMDEKLVYSFHMYAFQTDTRAQELADHAALATAQNTPLWCGEFGENTVAWVGSTAAMLRQPANLVSGQSFWTWKQRQQNNDYALIGITTATPEFQMLMDYSLSGWTAYAPDTDQMELGINEFLAAAALPQCAENSAMVTALLGQ